MTIIPTVEGAGNGGGVPGAWGGRRLGRGRWRLAGRVVAGVLRQRRSGDGGGARGKRAASGRAGAGPGARAWPAARAGARVAGGEGGRGVGGERGRQRERVSVSEREKKEKPSVWLSSPSLPSVRDAALGKDFLFLKYALSSARSATLDTGAFFAECHPGALGKD
jgi:hypothetical protein